MVGNGKSQVIHNPLPEDDPKRRKPDITRAQTLLGWNPTIDRASGLKITLEYFRSVL
jgi:dTDP-glucose 4,6-dehydratase